MTLFYLREPMNLRPFIAVLFASLLVPTVAADVQSTSLLGSTVHFESENAFVAFPTSPGKSFAMSIEGSQWNVRTHSDYRNSTVRSPVDGQYLVASEGKSNSVVNVQGEAEAVVLGGETVGRIIVRPLSPNYVAMVNHEGSFVLAPIVGELLDESHAWAGYTPRHPDYYQYVVNDTLRMGLDGKTDLVVQGDFQVYLWGVRAEINGAGHDSQVWTGHKSVERYVVNGYEPTLTEEQFTYATMLVYNGTLRYGSAEGHPVVYANEIGATSVDPVELQDAQGTVPGDNGDYVVAGSSVVKDGSFQWSHEADGRIGVKFLGTPGGVQGDSVAFQPAPLIERSWFVPAALALTALAAIAAAYLAPAAAGRRSADVGPGLSGLRAAGFRRWAAAADDRGHLRRAAFWAGRAQRTAPHDWDATLERAIYLAQVGRFSKALALHEAAHGGFQFLGDPEQLAHNAYEAARSAARLRRDEDAVDWLRVAVEADPGLATDMASDPSFSTLRAFPDYLSLRGPVAQVRVRP
ncbi:MAG: hypothetical protein ACYC2H_12700 [Thermoplasmatota archaeon]